MGFVEDQVRGTRSASDADLVQRSLSGNDDAFRELAERYDGMIRGIIRRFGKELGREEDDLAQNALLTAHRKLTNLRDAGRFDTWLWGITARICGKRAARLRQSSTSLQDVQEPVARDDGLTAVERMELRDRIAGFFSNGVGERNEAANVFIVSDHHDGSPRFLHGFQLLVNLRCFLSTLFQITV